MPLIKASGEENLRANPSVKVGSTKDNPATAGKSVGGTENLRADFKVFDGADRDHPGESGTDHRPKGVQNFDGLAGDR